MASFRWTLFVIVLLVPLSICRGQSGSSTVPRVENPPKAPKTQVVRLEELWRIGEDDEGVVFGAIGGMVADTEGRLYVADLQARQVSVFAPDGEFLRNLGREGEGPGEFREPRGLVVLPGGFVGIIREQPPAILRFRASDGEFVDNVHLKEDPAHPFQHLRTVVCRGKTFVVYASDFRASPQGMNRVARLMRFNDAGEFLSECDTLGFEFRFANPVTREHYDIMWQVGLDERVYVNRGREYGFDVHGLDCNVERVIAREYQRLKRPTAEVDSIREFYQRVGNIGNAKLEIFEHARDIAWFSVDDDGRLWVLSSRGRVDLPADSLGFFDVYDAQGRLDRTVDLKGERGVRDWYYMERDRFYVGHRETMSVVAYRLPRMQ